MSFRASRRLGWKSEYLCRLLTYGLFESLPLSSDMRSRSRVLFWGLQNCRVPCCFLKQGTCALNSMFGHSHSHLISSWGFRRGYVSVSTLPKARAAAITTHHTNSPATGNLTSCVGAAVMFRGHDLRMLDFTKNSITQRVHVGIWYILGL